MSARCTGSVAQRFAWATGGATMVRFGIRYALRRPAWAVASRQELYSAFLDQVEWADRMGFERVMLSEHHGCEDGYMPSPLVIGGAVAARTTQIRIHISSIIAPLHNMVRLAEDLAVLDVLSNGRVEPVVSGGYVGTEFEMLGTSLAARKEYMDELIPFLKKAWTGEQFEWKGQTMRVMPRPVQEPRPRIWMGGSSRASARRAARHADVFLPADAELYEYYHQQLDALGKPRPVEGLRPTLVWVAEDPDEFWESFGPHALHENNEYGKWYLDWDAWNNYLLEDDTDALRTTGRYPIVTPDELIDMCRNMDPRGSIMLHPLAGGYNPDLAWESLRLVEEKVLPAVRTFASGA